MNIVKHYKKALKVSKINVHATKIPENKTQLVTQETLDKVKNKFENTLK